MPAETLRLLREGDRWTYAATGRLTPPGLAISGTIEVSIVMAPTPAIAFVQALTMATPEGEVPFPAPPLMFWFEQEPETRDVLIFADTMTPDGSRRMAREGRVFYPGRWSAGTAYDNVLEFGAVSVRNTLTIERTEVVAAPVGTYEAWVGPITSQSSATGLIEGADWWTPELGAPIRFETRSTMPDGARMVMGAVMTATNVVSR